MTKEAKIAIEEARDGGYIVNGWVGKTKKEAIKVCLENIFF